MKHDSMEQAALTLEVDPSLNHDAMIGARYHSLVLILHNNPVFCPYAPSPPYTPPES